MTNYGVVLGGGGAMSGKGIFALSINLVLSSAVSKVSATQPFGLQPDSSSGSTRNKKGQNGTSFLYLFLYLLFTFIIYIYFI